MSARVPKYIQIKETIKNKIQNGELVDKIPGERVLATQLGASYMTVRKAVMELVEEGILHKNATIGTFVSHRKMSPKATHNIGFFLDTAIREGISSPYYSLIFKAMEKAVKEHGYNLLLFSDAQDMNPLINKKKVDGVVVCCFPRLEARIQEIKKTLPIVLLDNISSDKSLPSVTIDNFNSCRESTEYLWLQGHRRIGFISGLLDSDVSRDRLQGYQTALANHGIANDDGLVYKGDYSYESGERGADALLAQADPPTAIICANDSMAIGAMKVIQEKGMRVPEDVSVIGFDDIDVAARVFPPLTTNAAPIESIVHQSVELLISAIKGKDIDYKHVVLPTTFMLRGSCAKRK
jgi:DNA-binding LacI/PurR family transcriptional regulator